MAETLISTLGKPQRISNDLLIWELGQTCFTINKRVSDCVTVTLCNKELEKIASRDATELPAAPTISTTFTYGGPYFFSGSRPDVTGKVKLTSGIYSITSTYVGRRNFIVRMHSGSDWELVANEIGTSTAVEIIRVDEPIMEVFFHIKASGGRWKIEVKKVRVDS